MQNVLGSKNRASTLIGPYGKGKSFLVLILAYLVSFENTKSETYKRLLKKIGRIDKELVELVKEFREEKHYRLLPVVINSNYDDLTQSFRVSLDDAMRDYKLNDIAPDFEKNPPSIEDLTVFYKVREIE